MEARNAAGRTISLLNDAPSPQLLHPAQPIYRREYVNHYPTPRSGASSPDTPELLRSDSYDSHLSTEAAISPLTPSIDYPRASEYYQQDKASSMMQQRPSIHQSSRATSYEEDRSVGERPAKRYPCRYRDTHGCDKTFTTSGHASRHSKIHTAEKAVQCTFAGCQKKFTRADNMKQHLETHYKDKPRGSQRKAAAMNDARRNSNSSVGRHRSSTVSSSTDYMAHEPVTQYELPTPPVASPRGYSGSWEVRKVDLPLHGGPARTGLDALAMAVACQETAH